VLTFCFFLFNDKKKARPAGHNQLAGTAKNPSAQAEQERSGAGTRRATPPTKGKRNTPQTQTKKLPHPHWGTAISNPP